MSFLTWMHSSHVSLSNVISVTLVGYQYIRYQCFDMSMFIIATSIFTAVFQRQQPTSGGTVRSSRPANCCQHIPSNRFLNGIPDRI